MNNSSKEYYCNAGRKTKQKNNHTERKLFLFLTCLHYLLSNLRVLDEKQFKQPSVRKQNETFLDMLKRTFGHFEGL
jgi:hypothetical protein